LFAGHLLRAISWNVDVLERGLDDLAGRGASTHDSELASNNALTGMPKQRR
jgi:hypothetical protein